MTSAYPPLTPQQQEYALDALHLFLAEFDGAAFVERDHPQYRLRLAARAAMAVPQPAPPVTVEQLAAMYTLPKDRPPLD